MPFKKGQSGNPSGRKPKSLEMVEIEHLAKAYTREAVERLLYWMRSDNAKASVSAAQAILDRGHGKAKQVIDATIEHVVSTGDAGALTSRLRPAAKALDHTVQ